VSDSDVVDEKLAVIVDVIAVVDLIAVVAVFDAVVVVSVVVVVPLREHNRARMEEERFEVRVNLPLWILLDSSFRENMILALLASYLALNQGQYLALILALIQAFLSRNSKSNISMLIR